MRKHVVSQVKIPSNRIEAKHADVDRERTHSSDAQAENDFAQADTPPQSRDRGDSHLRFRTLPAQSRSSISQPRSQDSAGASRRKENPQVHLPGLRSVYTPTRFSISTRSLERATEAPASDPKWQKRILSRSPLENGTIEFAVGTPAGATLEVPLDNILDHVTAKELHRFEHLEFLREDEKEAAEEQERLLAPKKSRGRPKKSQSKTLPAFGGIQDPRNLDNVAQAPTKRSRGPPRKNPAPSFNGPQPLGGAATKPDREGSHSETSSQSSSSYEASRHPQSRPRVYSLVVAAGLNRTVDEETTSRDVSPQQETKNARPVISPKRSPKTLSKSDSNIRSPPQSRYVINESQGSTTSQSRSNMSRIQIVLPQKPPSVPSSSSEVDSDGHSALSQRRAALINQFRPARMRDPSRTPSNTSSRSNSIKRKRKRSESGGSNMRNWQEHPSSVLAASKPSPNPDELLLNSTFPRTYTISELFRKPTKTKARPRSNDYSLFSRSSDATFDQDMTTNEDPPRSSNLVEQPKVGGSNSLNPTPFHAYTPNPLPVSSQNNDQHLTDAAPAPEPSRRLLSSKLSPAPKPMISRRAVSPNLIVISDDEEENGGDSEEEREEILPSESITVRKSKVRLT